MTAALKRTSPKPAPASVQQLLDQAIVELDDVVRQVRLGVRDQRHFDLLEERGQAIAAQIRSAFRGAR